MCDRIPLSHRREHRGGSFCADSRQMGHHVESVGALQSWPRGFVAHACRHRAPWAHVAVLSTAHAMCGCLGSQHRKSLGVVLSHLPLLASAYRQTPQLEKPASSTASTCCRLPRALIVCRRFELQQLHFASLLEAKP